MRNLCCQIILIISCCSISLTQNCSAQEKLIRIGHFPNLTHAHALIAHNGTRSGSTWFESHLNEPVKIEWYTYNAGPSAMEALLLGAIDFAYVGPNPAINAFSRTKGKEVRILAGATTGGAALLVHADGDINTAQDFKGKTIATPQLGNTQDIAARSWLIKNGHVVTQTGGDVRIIPTENPDQLPLFSSGEIDAVWTVEPWVSRLELEARGKIFFEEKDAITTVLVASTKIIKENPELVRSLVSAHKDLSIWIAQHPEDAQARVKAELEAETSRAVPADLIQHAWGRMQFSAELDPARLAGYVSAAQQVGFLREIEDVNGLFYK